MCGRCCRAAWREAGAMRLLLLLLLLPLRGKRTRAGVGVGASGLGEERRGDRRACHCPRDGVHRSFYTPTRRSVGQSWLCDTTVSRRTGATTVLPEQAQRRGSRRECGGRVGQVGCTNRTTRTVLCSQECHESLQLFEPPLPWFADAWSRPKNRFLAAKYLQTALSRHFKQNSWGWPRKLGRNPACPVRLSLQQQPLLLFVLA